MGCLKLPIRRSRKVLQVVKVDGKVIEFKSTVAVKELLVNFEGFGVQPSRTSSKFLPPIYELQLGKTYYLSPFKCRVSAADGVSTSAAVKRIKIVITKKQLEELLSKNINSSSTDLATNWKPSLLPIPEENEFINM